MDSEKAEGWRNEDGRRTSVEEPRAFASHHVGLTRGVVAVRRIFLAARVAYRVLKGLEQDPLALVAQVAEWIATFL